MERYQEQKVVPKVSPWRFNHKIRSLVAGRLLRLELPGPARVHWSSNGWATVADIDTRDSGLGVHLVDLPTGELPAGSGIDFTFFWRDGQRWEGRDFRVLVA